MQVFKPDEYTVLNQRCEAVSELCKVSNELSSMAFFAPAVCLRLEYPEMISDDESVFLSFSKTYYESIGRQVREHL